MFRRQLWFGMVGLLVMVMVSIAASAEGDSEKTNSGWEVTVDRTQNVFEFDEHTNFPFAEILPNGDILLNISVGQHVVAERGKAFISRDGGKTWQEREPGSPSPMNLAVLPCGTTVVGLTAKWGGAPGEDGTIAATLHLSEDGGTTWQKKTAKVRLGGENKLYQHRSLVALPDGTLLSTLYGRRPGEQKYFSGLIRSTDGGENWEYFADIAYDPEAPKEGYCEPAMVLLANGDLLAMLRTGSWSPMFQTRSTDGGKTWSEPEQVMDHGVNPDLCLMENGVLVCSYGRPGAGIMFSHDGTGTKWEDARDLYTGPGSQYTSVLEIEPGLLMYFYDQSGFCETPGVGPLNQIRIAHVRVKDTRPNILFAIADDWGWPHAGAYGDPVVKTPTFDRLANEGVLFTQAYVSSPSCTPSRGAILTGQWHWRLGGAGNLWSVFPDRLATYPELLEEAGYSVGFCGKGWGPGKTETRGRKITGKRYKGFDAFLEKRPEGKPFCFWLGSMDPHRPYDEGSGVASGMDLDKVKVPGCFPDSPEVRSDVADYLWEVQRFDRVVGEALAALEKAGELENTIVVMTGDNGMPFPRCKSNVHDCGTRMPLAIRWPGKGKPGRVVDDFVSLTDMAPTFLESAGLEPLGEMTGRSLMNVLTNENSGQVVPNRDFVLVGKERHVVGQEAPDMGGYPSRAIRTADFMYIRNYRPDRWPAGTPNYEKAAFPGAWYADCDNGPTKTYMVENRDKDANHKRLFDCSFAKRPAEELYDLGKDPDQLENVADDAEYAIVKKELADRLTAMLEETGDPRVLGNGDAFDEYPYLGGAPKHPDWEEKE